MPEDERAVDPWSTQGLDASWERWRFEQPAFWRMVHAQNTPAEPQARAELEAIHQYAMKRYQERVQCLAL